MAKLRACAGCNRHIRASDEDCPFCAMSASPATAKKVATMGLMAAIGMTLAACYGGPSREDNLERVKRDGAGAADAKSQAPSSPSASDGPMRPN